MTNRKFSMLLCVLTLLSPLSHRATSGQFNSNLHKKTPTNNQSHTSNDLSEDKLDYVDFEFAEMPALNETIDEEWKMWMPNGSLVFHHERMPKGMDKHSWSKQLFDYEEIYNVQQEQTPANSTDDSELFFNATNKVLFDNVSFALVPEVLQILDPHQPCKDTVGQTIDSTICVDRQGRRKRPFHRFYPFLRRCRGRRRPLRCRRFRRRKKTTPRPSALLANFTFINHVNNQGYLTMSNTSNLNSSSRE